LSDGMASWIGMIHLPITSDVHSGMSSVSLPLMARLMATIEHAPLLRPSLWQFALYQIATKAIIGFRSEYLGSGHAFGLVGIG
jgi:hypothetical protein